MKNTLASLAESHGVEIKTGAEVDEATCICASWGLMGAVLISPLVFGVAYVKHT